MSVLLAFPSSCCGVELIESGLEAKEREKITFFDLADRLTRESDKAEQQRLKEELARMTFGDE